MASLAGQRSEDLGGKAISKAPGWKTTDRHKQRYRVIDSGFTRSFPGLTFTGLMPSIARITKVCLSVGLFRLGLLWQS